MDLDETYVREAKTDSHGTFRIEDVAPGTYPIQLLTESSDVTGVATAPMPPANIQVTGG